MLAKQSILNSINKKIDNIALNMEKFKFVDYIYYIEHPRKMLLSNFMSGIARGFGMAIGFTLLGAVLIYLLQVIVRWKLPLIGEFISEIVRIVQDNIGRTGGRVSG